MRTRGPIIDRVNVVLVHRNLAVGSKIRKNTASFVAWDDWTRKLLRACWISCKRGSARDSSVLRSGIGMLRVLDILQERFSP